MSTSTKRSLTDIVPNAYLRLENPPKKHKPNPTPKNSLFSKTAFASQEARDIVGQIDLQNNTLSIQVTQDIIAQIDETQNAINSEIQMLAGLNMDINLQPRWEAQSELFIIKSQLNDLVSNQANQTQTHITPNPNTNNNKNTNNHIHSDTDSLSTMEIDYKSSEDIIPNTCNDLLLSQLMEMGIDIDRANEALKHSQDIETCVEYCLNKYDSEHEEIEEKYEESNSADINTNSMQNNSEFIAQNNKCFTCGTKWRLANTEYYKHYKICDLCPDMRVLLSPKNESFACPQCIHNAHKLWTELVTNAQTNNRKYEPLLFGDYNNGNVRLCVLDQLRNVQNLYVQIKRDKYFEAYKFLGVRAYRATDDRTYIQIQRVDGKHSINIDLEDIGPNNIQWSYCPKNEYQSINTSNIKKIVSVCDDQISIRTNKDKSVITTCDLSQIRHTKKWLEYISKIKRKELNAIGQSLPKDLFKHTNAPKPRKTVCKKKKKRVKKAISVEVMETAALNSRHFNQNINNSIATKVRNQKRSFKCEICTLNNTSVTPNADNKYVCTVCEKEHTFSDKQEMDIDDSDTDNEHKTEHILRELSQKLNTNPNSNNNTLNTAPEINITLAQIESYQIVLVLGESGCGKSTLLRKLHSENPNLVSFLNPSGLEWNDNKAIISQFEESDTNKVIDLMSSIGLNSVRTWLKPQHILSNGERYRATMSRGFSIAMNAHNQWIIKDEFTSCLDRANARCIAASVSKFIRTRVQSGQRMGKFIFASSKADIIPYLQPDCVISLTGNGEYKLLANPNDLSAVSNIKPDIKADISALPPWNERLSHKKSIFDMSDRQFSELTIVNSIEIEKKVSRLQCEIEMDRHTNEVSCVFDVPFKGIITTDIAYLEPTHIPNGFEIGLIYGPSGSGKTTTGERMFGKIREFEWDNNRRVCEHFASVTDMEQKFEAVALSHKLGLSYYYQLSQGEQDRVNVAIQLGNDRVLIDEFTSNLDRVTAKRLAKGVREYVNRHRNKGIVLLSCHCDFIRELQPNWLFDIERKKVIQIGQSRNSNSNSHSLQSINDKIHSFIDSNNMWTVPVVRLYLQPTKWQDFKPFSKHHYMDASINWSASCFTVWAAFNGGERDCVGFTSVLANPFVNNLSKDLGFHNREHRTVILPPYQGLGFGSRVCDALATYLGIYDRRLQTKTAHPRYGVWRDRSPLWMELASNGKRMKRNAWHSVAEREKGIVRESEEEQFKTFYSHVFKLGYQRSESDEEYLKGRVIF